MADYDIFREQLAIKYPAYGHALWEPSSWKPDSLDKSVKVGDVGFIRNGRFHCLFNALLSAEEQSNVPEYHEKLVLKVSDHVSKGSLSSNHYCSAGISVEPEPEYHASSPNDFRQVSFKYPRKRGGAVLSLPVKARREDTLVGGYFGAWIVKHIDRWFAFAKELGLIDQMEEIILVTGCDHTRSWTNVAFFGNEYNAHATFGVKVDHGPAINIEWQSSPEHVQGAVLHRGPDGTNLPENQCVFIRGFRVARTFRILPKHLKAAGSPSPDSDGYDSEPDIEAVSIAATSKYRDPLHILLDYIAERASDCDMFLIHDDDLKRIDGLGDGTSLESLQPDAVMDLLRRSNIEIHSDLSQVSCDPNSSTEVIRVAMFSNPTSHLSIPPAAPVPADSRTSLPTTGRLNTQPSLLDATTLNPVKASHLLPPVPISTTSPSQPSSSLDPYPHPSQLSSPPAHLLPQVSRPVDGTPEPQSRRLFLQRNQPPSPKHDGSDGGSNCSIETGKSVSETEELRPCNGSYHNSPYSQVSELDFDSKDDSLGLFDNDPLVIPPEEDYNPSKYDAPSSTGLLTFEDAFMSGVNNSNRVSVSDTPADDDHSPAYYDHGSPASSNRGGESGGLLPHPFYFEGSTSQGNVSAFLSPDFGVPQLIRACSDGGHRQSRSEDLRPAMLGPHPNSSDIPTYPPSRHVDFLAQQRESQFLHPPDAPRFARGHQRSFSSASPDSRERGSIGGSNWAKRPLRPSPYMRSPSNSPARYAKPLPDPDLGNGQAPLNSMGEISGGTYFQDSREELPVARPNVTTTTTADASMKRRINDAKFQCPVPGCGSTFTRHFNLKGHLRSHNEEKPFRCKWPGCGKGFVRQRDCQRHEQLHSNHRPFICEGCRKPFARLDALNRHLRSEGGSGCLKGQELNLEQQSSLKVEPDAGGREDSDTYNGEALLM